MHWPGLRNGRFARRLDFCALLRAAGGARKVVRRAMFAPLADVSRRSAADRLRSLRSF